MNTLSPTVFAAQWERWSDQNATSPREGNAPAPMLFSTQSYGYFAQRMLALSRQAPPEFRDAVPHFLDGEVEHKSFPDGERYQRIETPVTGRDVVLVGGTISDTDTMELYDLAYGLVKEGARRLTIVMPYFSYGTMERAVKPGEVVTAKARARLFSSLPEPPFGLRVVLLDLHAEGIPHYFEGGLQPIHLYAKHVTSAAIQRVGGDDFVLASTDAGRAKWVESLATQMNVDVSFAFKRRNGPTDCEVTAVSAHVEGRHVVIYDDMVRSGASLICAAKAYRDAGAKSLACVVTHGLFPGDSLAKLRASGLFTTMVATDSHPRAVELADDFLQVDSVAGLITCKLSEMP